MTKKWIAWGARSGVASLTVGLLTCVTVQPAPAETTTPDLARYERVGKCLTIDEMQFCTDIGFLGLASGAWRERLARSLATSPGGSGTQDLSETVAILEKLSPGQLVRRQQRQIAEARRGARKVALASSFDDPTRQALASQARLAAAKFPTSRYIIYDYYTEQINSRYCGPATMQAIDWADDGTKETQDYWAPRVGYSSGAGTNISGMASDINAYTSWDDNVGSYVVADVTSWTLSDFWWAHQNNIGAHASPVVENPLLRMEFFDYLVANHGGHLQTGRGYDTVSQKVSIFEPYEEQDYVSGAGHTGKVQYVPLANMLGAVKANIGKISY